MAQTAPEPQLTYQQFLDFVAGKEGRYEYVDGRAVAMGTPSNEHQDISLIVASALRDHLRGQRCKVRTGAALWTTARERSPDILVTCHEGDLARDARPNRYPKLVIEILSENQGDDLEGKLDEYEAVGSIEEYIIIDSTKRSVRRWYRNAAGKFEFDPYCISGLVRFESVSYTLDIDALYDEVGI